MSEDPFILFDSWFAEANAAEPGLAEAMTLATATPDGHPSARIVLLKDHGPDGFTFYTNGESRKGGELKSNGEAALLFYWKSLARQIRIEGSVAPVSDAEADAYFASRARDSQLGAVASDQSRPLDDRQTFLDRVEAARERFDGRDVERPPHWGGWRVTPRAIEFWQDMPFRLHHRRLFTRQVDGSWTEGLLYP